MDARCFRALPQGSQDNQELQDEGVFPMHQGRLWVLLPHQQERRRPLPNHQVGLAHVRAIQSGHREAGVGHNEGQGTSEGE